MVAVYKTEKTAGYEQEGRRGWGSERGNYIELYEKKGGRWLRSKRKHKRKMGFFVAAEKGGGGGQEKGHKRWSVTEHVSRKDEITG